MKKNSVHFFASKKKKKEKKKMKRKWEVSYARATLGDFRKDPFYELEFTFVDSFDYQAEAKMFLRDIVRDGWILVRCRNFLQYINIKSVFTYDNGIQCECRRQAPDNTGIEYFLIKNNKKN